MSSNSNVLHRFFTRVETSIWHPECSIAISPTLAGISIKMHKLSPVQKNKVMEIFNNPPDGIFVSNEEGPTEFQVGVSYIAGKAMLELLNKMIITPELELLLNGIDAAKAAIEEQMSSFMQP